MKAMIFAAGLGTRLRPWTDTKPKALIEYKQITLLERVIIKLKNSGFNQIVINVHHFAEQIVDFVKSKNYFDCEIVFSDESDLLLDTGGGLKKTSFYLKNKDSFLVYNVDILSEINLKDFYDNHLKNNALATLAVQERQTSRVLFFDSDNYLCSWKNFKTEEEKISRHTNLKTKYFAFSGLHIISPQIFELITEEGKFSIIDLYLRLAKTNKISYYLESEIWRDMGKKENYTVIDNNL